MLKILDTLLEISENSKLSTIIFCHLKQINFLFILRTSKYISTVIEYCFELYTVNATHNTIFTNIFFLHILTTFHDVMISKQLE